MTSAPRQFEQDPIERVLMRLMFALVVLRCLPPQAYDAQPHPNGLATFIDLTFFANPEVGTILHAVLLGALALYVAGLLMPLAVGYTTFMFVGLGTLANSQGAIGHSRQVVGLVLVGQLIAYVWSAVRGGRPALRADAEDHRLAYLCTLQMIGAAYVVAGVTKLLRSGLDWIVNLPNISVQIAKTHEQGYYNALDAELLDKGTWLSELIVAHPHLTRLVFGGGLVVELLAIFMIINRRAAFATGLVLLVMHELIKLTMSLDFYYNELVLLVFCINVPFLLSWCVRRLSGRSPGAQG